jgi:hypothetical protein
LQIFEESGRLAVYDPVRNNHFSLAARIGVFIILTSVIALPLLMFGAWVGTDLLRLRRAGS